MNIIDTQFFLRCILTLEKAHDLLLRCDKDEISYEIYRSACIKEFEIILEQSGALLKKSLKPYFHSAKAVASLTFKDIFRQAAKFDLISLDACERWLMYRDNRNHTAHDYGVNFAEHTLTLLPAFIQDATALEKELKEQPYD